MTENETWFIERMLEKRYKKIEKYLENILNSPSTINKILKYYQVGFSTDYSEMYIMFQDKIIHTYGISKDDYYLELKIETWIACGMGIHTPSPIIYL